MPSIEEQDVKDLELLHSEWHDVKLKVRASTLSSVFGRALDYAMHWYTTVRTTKVPTVLAGRRLISVQVRVAAALEGGEVEITDVEGNDHTLNAEKLAKGISMWIVRSFNNYRNANPDDCSPTDCDTMVQYALFGEIKFDGGAPISRF